MCRVLSVLLLGSLLTTVLGQNQGQNQDPYPDYGSTSHLPSAQNLPDKTQVNQTGTNRCGTQSSDDSLCQNLYLAGPTDWCLYAPPVVGAIGDFEADAVSYCTKAGRGTRTIPPGVVTSVTFVYAPGYVQVTGVGDLTKLKIAPNDDGGEMDAHGATGTGNPKGDLVFIKDENGKWQQAHEWMNFMSDKEFCIRACYDGNLATTLCRHVYDTLGCSWNMPGNYTPGVYQVCHTENAMDVAFHDGKEYHQDDGPAPDPYPPPRVLDCTPFNEADLYGNITSGAFSNGNNTQKVIPYTGPLDHSVPNGAPNGGGSINITGGNNNPPGQNSNNKGGASGSSSGGTPTSTNACISVTASQQLGYVFITIFMALLGGCLVL
ncbi:unnamed protein product [Sympodiomycopsis kandeliae]